MTNYKKNIANAIDGFNKKSLRPASIALFQCLGYQSDKTIEIESIQDFCDQYDPQKLLEHPNAYLKNWTSVELLFQLTDEELSGHIPFFKNTTVKTSLLQSYVFFAIELEELQGGEGDYSRSKLAGITRQINRIFPMPVMVLFKIGNCLSLALINRRQNKRDDDKDVLGKVTLIQNIAIDKPHPGHLDILASFSLQELSVGSRVIQNFDQLHAAWEVVFNVELLNKRFYEELSNWYFWAIKEVRFPDGIQEKNVIRLITRLIFVWFIKERELVPNEIFDITILNNILKKAPDAAPEESSFYKAILQNLFFATLNMEMGQKRRFRGMHKSGGHNVHRGIHNVYRYEDAFKNPESALKLFKDVPFLNGGLFECLDKFIKKENSNEEVKNIIRIDGFSDEIDNILKVPNKLFFSDSVEIDLNDIFATRNKRYITKGLIKILDSYKFTIDENTPLEQEVALDPELLGKVFENLLASYNPETSTTARKQTGSFYTPREIVDYMVDESLITHFNNALQSTTEKPNVIIITKLRNLLSYTDTSHDFSPIDVKKLIQSIDSIKVLDPACGSGAFPMGVLLKLVHILTKLDPKNKEWKQRQIDRINSLISNADAIEADEVKSLVINDLEKQREDVEDAFLRNELNYGRKLYLIQNCIFGVDIQPIAVQISKLRFFISLIVNETIDANRPNRGIRPLPNLETKFVAANTLIDIEQPKQSKLSSHNVEISRIENDLKRIREKHFHARTQDTKNQCRERDAQLRNEFTKLLELDGFNPTIAKQLAAWNPYDLNAAAPFFDSRWMFEISNGFDIVIGNPPYLRVQGIQQTQPEFIPLYRERFESATGSFDLYALFIERGYNLLHSKGQLSYIVPHKFFQATFGVALRKLLTQRKALRQIVRFGAAQVFDEATTYTCLLFLGAQPKSEFDLLEVRSLAGNNNVLNAARTRTAHPDYAYGIQTAPKGDDWDFTLGESNKVMERLRQHPRTLGDITRKIFVGLQTSADKIYVLKLLEDKGDILRCYSKQLDIEIEIERGLVRPFLMGKDVHRYQPAKPQNMVIFPYRVDHGKAQLLTQDEIKNQFPLGWSYLIKNKKELEAREHGRFASSWWCFSRPQNMAEFLAVKVMTPDICARSEMTLDLSGNLYHTTTVYSFVFKEEIKESPLYFLGLLNSKVIWYFLSVTGNVLRGGYLRFKTEYLKPFPIPDLSTQHQELIATFASYILALKREESTNPLMVAWFEQLIDALVYELYFPEEFSSANARVSTALCVSAIELPTPESLGDSATQALTNLFNTLYEVTHPVRRAAFFIDSIPAVRVIEGKA